MLAGQKLGIKEVDDGIWLASFVPYDLGYFDKLGYFDQKQNTLLQQSLRGMDQYCPWRH